MRNKIRRLENVRIHHEGTSTLIVGLVSLVLVSLFLFLFFETKIPFWIFVIPFSILYFMVLNFYRCPIRQFGGDTERVVVAPADGKIVVVEEVYEDTFFHDRRLMVSIFMSLFNVHANWFPVDGTVKSVKHHDGCYYKAWLPKASKENEHSDIVITTPEGVDILCRQVAGAMARRIVTYANPGDECYIDEHLGFIKLGSRVDLFLPLGTEINVEMGQKTVGDHTIICKLKV